MNLRTRTGISASVAVSNFGIIEDLDKEDFQINKGIAFYVKNESDTDVQLEVIPAMGNDYVNYLFEHGWNEVLVKKVKKNSTTATLLWGY